MRPFGCLVSIFIFPEQRKQSNNVAELGIFVGNKGENLYYCYNYRLKSVMTYYHIRFYTDIFPGLSPPMQSISIPPSILGKRVRDEGAPEYTLNEERDEYEIENEQTNSYEDILDIHKLPTKDDVDIQNHNNKNEDENKNNIYEESQNEEEEITLRRSTRNRYPPREYWVQRGFIQQNHLFQLTTSILEYNKELLTSNIKENRKETLHNISCDNMKLKYNPN